MPTECGCCHTPFKEDLPDWQATTLCDRCTAELMNFVVAAETDADRKALIASARTLYGRTDLPTPDTSQPCDADT